MTRKRTNAVNGDTHAPAGIRNRVVEVVKMRLGDLAPHPRNWRRHPDAQRAALRGVLADIGWAGAVLAYRGEDGALTLIDGHLRGEEAADIEVPVIVLDVDEREADYLLATHDPLASLAEANREALDALLRDVNSGSAAVQEMLGSLAEAAGLYQNGSDRDDTDASGRNGNGSLVERFGVPPFSVLDARQGYWQDRKRAWLALGIQSELGRGGDLLMMPEQVTEPGLNYYRNRKAKRAPAEARGPLATTADVSAATGEAGR